MQDCTADRLARDCCTADLMDRPAGHHSRIKFDFAERVLISDHVLLQDCEQRLGLLRAQVNALKIPDLYLSLALLLECAKNQEEVPYIYPHLNAVCIGFLIIRRVEHLDVGLNRNRHKFFSVAQMSVAQMGRVREIASFLTWNDVLSLNPATRATVGGS